MEKNKTCLHCGKELTGQRTKFCSTPHSIKYHYLKNLDKKRIRDRIWNEKNKDKEIARKKKWYKEHLELTKGRAKDYYEDNKENVLKRTKEYTMNKYHNNEKFRMRVRLGRSLTYVLKSYVNTGRIMNPQAKYCIDWEGIIEQLKPFPKNREAYHVDHIIPLCRFDLTDWKQVRIAFAPENHQWLKVKDNLIKGGREKLISPSK